MFNSISVPPLRGGYDHWTGCFSIAVPPLQGGDSAIFPLGTGYALPLQLILWLSGKVYSS